MVRLLIRCVFLFVAGSLNHAVVRVGLVVRNREGFFGENWSLELSFVYLLIFRIRSYHLLDVVRDV